MFHRLSEGSVGVEILTDLFAALREHTHGGDTFIEADLGKSYQVRLINRTAQRVLAVLTVDGLSVMNGKPGGKDDSGYVLHPYQPVDIPGWRLDNAQVARFVFAAPGSSYAERTGQPANVGVVGCCFWAEKLPDNYHLVSARGSAPFPEGRSRGFANDQSYEAALGGKLLSRQSETKQAAGTGFGQRQDHQVQTVSFDRSHELATLVLRYNTREELLKAGVIKEAAVPEPFPKNHPAGCTPPAGWSG